MDDELAAMEAGYEDGGEVTTPSATVNFAYACDRCGSKMTERNCKITCPNCGHRFDCSDLNIYFD